MTGEVLDRLRASNPLPHGSKAPEFETLLARLRTVDPGRVTFRRFRPLVPVLSLAVALLVLIGALAVLHSGDRAAVSQKHRSAPRPAVPVVPRGGMRGVVSVVGAGFSSSGDGVISLQQCLGCLPDGNQTPHSRDLYWLARTVNGGRSWSLTKEHYYLQRPQLVGRDGWAGGLEAPWSQAGGTAEYFVTHDGGQTWRVAPAAAPNQGGAVVSIGGGEVWATGLTPTSLTIMHAPVSGSRLSATAAQPIHGGPTNVQVIAGGSGTAYVSNTQAARQTFVTHDDGETWQRMGPACPSGEGAGLVAAYGDTVWAECYFPRSQRQVLSRSDDAGRNWQQVHPSIALTTPPQPVSSDGAWALSGESVVRTTDGGLTWSTVWSAATSQPPSLRSKTPHPIALGLAVSNPLLIAQSPSSATLVTAIPRGGARQRAKLTNLAVYRTTDGGRAWQPYVVPLGGR